MEGVAGASEVLSSPVPLISVLQYRDIPIGVGELHTPNKYLVSETYILFGRGKQ